MANKVPDELDQQLWWTLALVASTAVLLGRRGFVHYVEQGKSAAQVFALRAHSLPYISAWAIIASLAVILAFFHDTADGIGVAGFVLAEFVAVCLWRDYFGNSDFVTQYVEENKERLRYLLTHGLGMNVNEFEEFCHTVEGELVEFWWKQLKNRKWSQLGDEELGTLLFSSGVESARVMTRALWEGVLFDVAAFMREWLSGIERVRIPPIVVDALRGGSDADDQALFCVGIILANETREVRLSRASSLVGLTCREFSAARIARRKTAAEGILHWPNCLSCVDDVAIRNILWDTDRLYIKAKTERLPCGEKLIPVSVMYSVIEIIQAGYLNIPPQRTLDIDITFKYANMVFKKDDWNQLRTVERKPFRYITSATWMADDPAFMVEQREITGHVAEFDGSGHLEGVLRVVVDLDVKEAEQSWLQLTDSQQRMSGIWGNVQQFIQPRPICILNMPMVWMIEGAWSSVTGFAYMREMLSRVWRLRAPDALPAPRSQMAIRLLETVRRLLFCAGRRDPAQESHHAELVDVCAHYRSRYEQESPGHVQAPDEGPSYIPPSSTGESNV